MSTQKNSICVKALGRYARIGDLYNAVSDEFSYCSVFKKPNASSSPLSLPFESVVSMENHLVASELIVSDKKEYIFKKCDVAPSMQLSIMAGLLEPADGIGKALSDAKENKNIARVSFLHHVDTHVERMNIFNSDLEECIDYEALQFEGATHVVVQVRWGANVLLSVETDISDKLEMEENREIVIEKQKKKIQKEVEKAGLAWGIGFLGSLVGLGKTTRTETETVFDPTVTSNKQFTFRMIGDVIPDSIPLSLNEAVGTIKQVPELIKRMNGGKGKPLEYTMVPIQALDTYFKNKERIGRLTVKDVPEDIALKCAQKRSEVQQREEDLDELLRKEDSRDKKIEIQKKINEYKVCQAKAKSGFAKAVCDFRAGILDASKLPDIASGIVDYIAF